ncbi:NACHT domain-containing protein [Longispora urticae]
MEFETDEATDDITCRMSAGEAAYISAKLAVGNDQQLRDTVRGWALQVARLNDLDLLVLASRELKGDIKWLPDALDRRRRGLGGSSAGERRALKAFDALLVDLDPDVRERVQDAARVLVVPASAAGLLDREQFIGQLEGNLVWFGSGGSVLDLLAKSFHDQAATATGSTLQEWVRALRAKGIQVFADLKGPMGAQIAARQRGLEQYREVLQEPLGSLDLSLLAADLPALTVVDMLDGIGVLVKDDRSSSGQPILSVVRRWGRLVLFGLPGAGKSVALRELAGTFAGDELAPTPVQVSLRTFADRDLGSPLGLHDLLAGATERVSLDQRPALTLGLTELAEAGEVVFLCDGLDECGDRAGWVSEQLRRVLSELPEGVGLVLATRSSAALAAAKLGLPTATLKTPGDLRSTLKLVLKACADRRVQSGDRAAWLTVRERWLSDADSGHRALLEVPLLAILLALVAAEARDDDLPRERAILLHRAVQDSVQTWESQRTFAAARWPNKRAPSGKMLLDGFTVIGSELGSRVAPSSMEALAALVEYFSGDRWRQAPAEAEETAEQVLDFWDDHVGVFVVGVDGNLSSRSQIFVEVAEAMATLRMTYPQLIEWVREHLAFLESEGALSLALGLNVHAVAAILELGKLPVFTNAPTILADVVIEGKIILDASQLDELAVQLALRAQEAPVGAGTHARPRRRPSKVGAFLDAALGRETVHSPAWPFVRRLSQLSLPPGEGNDARIRALTQVPLPTDVLAVATALVAVGRAQNEQRALDADEVRAIQAALDLPLPAEPRGVRENGRRFRMLTDTPVISGLPTLARHAIAYLGQLEERSPKAIYDLGRKSSRYESVHIQHDLKVAGVDILPWKRDEGLHKVMAALREGFDDTREELILLEDIASISSVAVELGRDDRWSLAEVGNLVAVTGYATISYQDFRAAFRYDTEELRRRWLSVLAKTYNIDPAVAAAQARSILASPNNADLWHLITIDPSKEVTLCENVELLEEEQDALISCLTAHSWWIAWSAAEVLANSPFPAASQRLLALLPTGRHRSDRTIAMAAALVAEDAEGVTSLLVAAPESATRAGAADALIVGSYSTGVELELLTRLASDEDLTVRRAALGRKNKAGIVTSEVSARFWSCQWCGRENALTEPDCAGCELSSFPRFEDESDVDSD